MPESVGVGRAPGELERSGAAARRDAEALLGPATDLAADATLDRRQVRAVLPHVLVDVPVALLLVDQRSHDVVYANQAALHLAGDVTLPLPLGDWGSASALTDLRGQPLNSADGVLGRVLAGAPTSGEAVRSAREEGGGLGRLLWATGIPLGESGAPGSEEAPLALLMFLEVATPPGAEDDPEALLAALRNRAVIATDLAFTISDPAAPDNPLRWVNPAFSRMTGYEAEDAIGRNCRFLQGRGTDPAVVDEIRAAIAARTPLTVTLLNYRKDGSPFWNQLSISPVFDGEGELISFVGVQYDVSERVRSDTEREAALEAERAARQETERARSRLALLAEVTTQLSATLDTTESLERLADLVVPALADWVVVNLYEDDQPAPRLVMRHRDGRERLLARYAAAQPEILAGHPVLGPIMAGGDPVLVERFEPGRLEALVPEEVGEVVRELGLASALYVPLVARQRKVLGTMVLISADPQRPYSTEDLGVAVDLGRRAGITLDNARLYEREHRVAEILQRSLLPAIPPVPGASASASYLPANAVADVGGDFYELLPLPDGSVGVAVGDVVGHDVAAAAAMGHLRGLLRACAWDNASEGTSTDPARVLDRVDRLVQGLDVVPLATLLYAWARPATGGWELTWSSAGHPPPLLRLPGGEVEVLTDAGGVLLGVGGGGRTNATRTVPPGTTLLGYTDGLVERRGEHLDRGTARLAVALGAADPADLDALIATVVGEPGSDRDDDIAVIAVRLDAPTV